MPDKKHDIQQDLEKAEGIRTLDDKGNLIVFPDITKLNKESKPLLYQIFLRQVNDKPYLSRIDKLKILDNWSTAFPKLKRHNLVANLYNYEMRWYESIPKATQDALIMKMTLEHEELKDRVLTESSKDIVYQAGAIVDLNNLTAKIHKLSEAPSQINIYMETNVDEDLLTKSISAGQTMDIEVIEEAV